VNGSRRSPGALVLRALVTVRALADNLVGGWGLVADPRSFTRWAVDAVRYRQLRLWGWGRGRRRTIRVRQGVALTYRLDRGDIRVLAETWLSRAYELPPDVQIRPGATIVDLGANIGLTGLWLARRHACRALVAVEPSPANAELARLNLGANEVPAQVIEAAVGPADGVTRFSLDEESTLGHVAADGVEVRMVAMETVLARLDDGAAVDLLKMDIEGGEIALLGDGAPWLDRVGCIVAELHPDAGDVEELIGRLEARGFRYRRLVDEAAYGPRGTEFMACFDRVGAGS
jgi:FkbM family methyltransferase